MVKLITTNAEYYINSTVTIVKNAINKCKSQDDYVNFKLCTVIEKLNPKYNSKMEREISLEQVSVKVSSIISIEGR